MIKTFSLEGWLLFILVVIISYDEDNPASGSRLNVSHSCGYRCYGTMFAEGSEMGDSLFILLGGQVSIAVGPFPSSGGFSYVMGRCL